MAEVVGTLENVTPEAQHKGRKRESKGDKREFKSLGSAIKGDAQMVENTERLNSETRTSREIG